MAEFVPYTQRETYQLHDIPLPHLRNIHRRSVKRNTSYANVVVKVLADRCDVPFVPSQRKRVLASSPLNKIGDSLSVRVPVAVMNCVREEAEREQITIRSVILNALSDAFHLKRPPATHVEPGSRPGRRKEK